MFERFTAAARAAVVDAVTRARADGTRHVGVDHLLAAVLPATTAVTGLTPDAAREVLAALAAARRRAGLSDLDAHALAGLGIDLDAVVEAVERGLGADALTGRAADARGARARLTAPARAALGAGLRQARALGDRALDAEHLLLGVLAQRDDRVPADVLAARGVTMATVIEALGRSRRGAA